MMLTEKIMNKEYSIMNLPAAEVTLKYALHNLQSLQFANSTRAVSFVSAQLDVLISNHRAPSNKTAC